MKKQSNITDKGGFKIPDNYFEDFQEKLNNKLAIEKKKNEETKVVSLLPTKLKYMLYIAASVILLIGITFSYNNSFTIETQITSVTDTIETIKENIQLDLTSYNNDDELLALFIEDEHLDEYLDEYLIDGVISQN